MNDMILHRIAKFASFEDQIDTLKQNLSKYTKENESLMTSIQVLKTQTKEKEDKYLEKEIDLEKEKKELENIVYKVVQSAQTMHMLTKPQVFYDNTHKQALGYQNLFYLKKAQRINPTLYNGIVISKKHDVVSVDDSEETLILAKEKQAFWLPLSNLISKQLVVPHTPVKIEVPKELQKHSMLNVNSELICVTCNECMFDAIHDLCVLDFVNDVNVRSKSKSAKRSKKRKVWKPAGKVFTDVGYRWIPTGQKFTIDGNRFPLTRITSTNVVPPKNPLPTKVTKKTTPHRNNPKMLKDVTNISSSSKSKVVESNISNNSKPNQNWGSNVSTDPSSPCVNFRWSKSSSGTWTLVAPICHTPSVAKTQDETISFITQDTRSYTLQFTRMKLGFT
ncbi:hypothetical protein Tco_0830819 [Tanacetum coccineum]